MINRFLQKQNNPVHSLMNMADQEFDHRPCNYCVKVLYTWTNMKSTNMKKLTN